MATIPLLMTKTSIVEVGFHHSLAIWAVWIMASNWMDGKAGAGVGVGVGMGTSIYNMNFIEVAVCILSRTSAVL